MAAQHLGDGGGQRAPLATDVQQRLLSAELPRLRAEKRARHALLESCGVQPCSSGHGHVQQRLRVLSDPNPTPAPHQVRFEERYCSGKVIGTGAFSTVHSATCLQTGRLVAVKRVAKLRLSSRETERLNSEVTILRKCRHPHVVALINHFETPATTCADTCVPRPPYGTC